MDQVIIGVDPHKLSATIDTGLRARDVQERMAALGVDAVGGTPEQAAAYIDAEARKWVKVLKAAGIRAD